MNYRIAGLLCFIAFGTQVYLLNEHVGFMFHNAFNEKTVFLSCLLIPMFIYGYGKTISIFRRKEFPTKRSAVVFLGLTSLMGIFIILAQVVIWSEAIHPPMR